MAMAFVARSIEIRIELSIHAGGIGVNRNGLFAAFVQSAISSCSRRLAVQDRCVLYTDGLLEARAPSGEIFSFERLHALYSAQPDAEQASRTAVAFGQEDDITVLTLTREGKA